MRIRETTRCDTALFIHLVPAKIHWWHGGRKGHRVLTMGGWTRLGDRRLLPPRLQQELMLVGAVGIKPEQVFTDRSDIFIISPAQINDLIFHDPTQAPRVRQTALRAAATIARAEAEIGNEGNREMAEIRLLQSDNPICYDARGCPTSLRMVR